MLSSGFKSSGERAYSMVGGRAQDALTGDHRLDGRQQEGISHSTRG